ncbi:MAG: substrate-binding domain-containing protein [Verrucomicrobiota bacterium]
MQKPNSIVPAPEAENLTEPLYNRVLRMLEARLDEEFSDGDRFPTERQLINDLNVSQPTVRRALQELVNKGRLYRHVGRGTFVLRKRSSRVLGIVLPTTNNKPQAIQGFARISDEYDCNIRVHYLSKNDTAEEFRTMIKADPDIERLVFIGHTQERIHDLYNCFNSLGFRTICGSPLDISYLGNHVYIDQQKTTNLILDHLLDLGHRRITFIINEPDQLATICLRKQALEAEISRRSLDQDVVIHHCQTPNWSNSFQAAFDAMPAVLAQDPQPTAIVAFSGVGTLAVVRYATMHGISIPGTFSTVSYDDIPFSDLIFPTLSRLVMPEYSFARAVMELAWSNNKAVQSIALSPKLQIAESSARPQAR